VNWFCLCFTTGIIATNISIKERLRYGLFSVECGHKTLTQINRSTTNIIANKCNSHTKEKNDQ